MRDESSEDAVEPEDDLPMDLAAGLAIAGTAAAVGGAALVSRKRQAELREEQRRAMKAHRKSVKSANAAAAEALATRVHPRPGAPEAVAVPAWAADFHDTHSPFYVGGWMFCTTCGTRHSGKGSADAARPCRKDLEDKSTQRYLTRTLRQGRLPKQLASASQWPDGVDLATHPLRPVYRLVPSADGSWRLAIADAPTAAAD